MLSTMHECPAGFHKYLAVGLGLFIALAATPLWSWIGLPGGWLWGAVRGWSLTLALVAVVLFWEGLPLRSIGFRGFSWRDVLWGVAGFILGLLAFGVSVPLVQALGVGGDAASGVARLATLPFTVRLLLVLTAAVTEEVLFRGYPIERVTALTGSPWWGAGITYVVFVGLHASFWGVGGAIQIGAWSLIVTALYLRRRSLLPCIIMHVLNDAWAFLLLPMLIPLPAA